MPLNRYQIRNEYSLADPDLYRIADKDDPEALLEGVAMAGLVGVLRQLGDLAEFAAEIFHDLHEEVMATAARGHGLIVRVQQLEAEFPSIERTLLSQTSHTAFLYNSGIDWHPNLNMDQNLVTREDLPRFVMDSYEECRGPPRLFLLDKFDVAGAGACLKRYTDPSFFKLESTFSSVRKPEGQREKRTRKMKKRGIRGRNGETPESFPSSHAKLHQLFLEERIENGGSDLERRVKLKKRQLSGTMSDQESGKNYMEKFLETCLQERTVHEISVDPLPLTLVPYNNDSPNESGLGIVEIRTISPPKESSQTDKMSRATTETWKPVVKPSLDELKEVTDTESIEVPRPKYDQDIGEIPSTPTKDVNEEELPNTESPSEHTSDEYSPGEATSEVEDYMDALPTMESEGETDSEYKRNLHYRSIKPIVVDSEGSEGPHDLQTLFPDSQSVGNSTASGEGNCFFRKERDNFSCSDTISNFGEDPSGGDGNVMTFNHRTMAEETPGNKDEKHVSMGKPNDGLDPEEASGTSCITDLNTTLLLADTGASPRENSVPKPELDELSSGLIMPDSVAAAIGQEWPDQSTYSSRRRNYYEMNSEDPIISSESLQDPPNVTSAFEDDGGARDPINKIQSELSEADSVPKMVDNVMDSSNSFGSPAEGIVDSNLPPIVDSNICPEESLQDRMSVLESTEVSTRQDLQIAETIDTNSPSQAYLSLEGLSYSCDEPSVKPGSAAADGEESAAAFPTVPQTGMSLPISEQLLLEETEASETPELDSAEDGVAHSQDGSNSRRSPETPQNDLMDGIVVVGKSSPVLDSSIPGPELPREITDSGLLPKHHSVEGGDTDIYSENDSNTEGLSQSVDGDKLYSPLNVNAVEKDDIHLDDATICPQQSASTPLAEEDTHSDDTETELVQAEAMGTYCHHNVSDGDKDEISHDVNLPVENADESGLGSISVGEVKSGLDHGIRKHDDAETVAAAARKDDVDYEHDQNDITESSTIDCSSPCFPEALQEESLFINEDPRQKDEDIKELQNHHCTDGSYSTLAKDMQNSTPPVGVLEASLSSEKNERDLESTSSRANTVFEDDISVCSHNLARQEEIVTPIQTSVDFPTGSIVGATSETCLGQPSLPESTKQTIEVASDACEQYENLTRCEPEPGLPTLGMLPGAFQVNLDETPPLPPLPPMQWRLGKLHHASLASARPLKQQTIDDVQLTPPPNNDDKTKMLSERSEVEEWDIPPLLATVDNLQNNTVCAGSVQDGPSISNHATLQTPENGPQLSEQESPRPSSNPLEQGLPDEGEEIQPKSDAKDEEVEFNEFVPPPRMGYEEVQPLGLTASEGERARSSHASDISSSSGDVHVNGTLQKKIPRPRNPLIDEVVAIDKSKLRKVGERVKTTTETKTEERESPPEWTQLRKVGVKAKSQDEPRPEQEWTRLRKVGVTAKSQDEPRPEPEWTQLRKAGVTVKSQDEPRPEPEWTQLRKVGVTAKSQAEPRPEPEWTQLRKLEVTAKSQDELRPEPEWAQLRKVGVTAKSQDEPRPEPEWAQLRKVGVTAKSQDEPRPEPEWAQLRKVGLTAKSQDELTTEQRDSVPENMPLKRVGERVKSEAGSTAEERDSLLEQIRNKSFSLKPAVATRPNVQGPRTNLKVAAILEKASTIRQAMAGSDEEDDADNWSDS